MDDGGDKNRQKSKCSADHPLEIGIKMMIIKIYFYDDIDERSWGKSTYTGRWLNRYGPSEDHGSGLWQR